MGTPPTLGWNRVGSGAQKNLEYLRNGAGYDQGYYDGLTGSCIRAFDGHQNQRPWITLNGRNVTLAEINKVYGVTELRSPQTNYNENFSGKI